MIATILPGSSNFHAVGYNERKVSKGVARLLEIRNFGVLGTFGKPTPDDLVEYLQEYSSRNDRIKKSQFHVAISCKGHEMSEEELLRFAHRYLSEMGYGEPGQPLLVYSHYDTDNLHLHAVTSRIRPDGKKVAHDHERRRSQEVIDHILSHDRKKSTENDVNAAKLYTFSSFAQYKAIMVSMGYEAYQKDGMVFIKRGGRIQQKMSLSDIEAQFQNSFRNQNRCRQLRVILKKYRDVSANKEELQKELKNKFGLDLVFFGKKDTPFGYMIVDHANKVVIHGGRVLAMEELLDFVNPKQRFDRIENYIDQLLTLNPKITQGEIFQKLKNHHAYIEKGSIYYDGQSRPLTDFLANAIDRNNRIEWVEKFNPTTEDERNLLCSFYKVSRVDLVSLSLERSSIFETYVNRLREIFEDETSTVSVRSQLRGEGFSIHQDGDATYAINFQHHIIINLTEEGFNLERLKYKSKSQQKNNTKKKKQSRFKRPHLPKLKDSGGGSHSETREWEVGQKGNYDDIDDGRMLKR